MNDALLIKCEAARCCYFYSGTLAHCARIRRFHRDSVRYVEKVGHAISGAGKFV